MAQVFHEAGQELRLTKNRGHYELMIGHVPILTSAALGTERDFGKLAGKYSRASKPRVVIGGLGFGSTLAGALHVLPQDAEVLMVEKLKTVIDLVSGPLSHLAPQVLKDPRVRLIQEDVCSVIARENDLDAILLDVDNGPEWGSFKTNARLYNLEGLRTAKKSLCIGGAFAVWSGYPCDHFSNQLREVGFIPSCVLFHEHGKLQARAYVGRNGRVKASRNESR